MKTYQLLGDPGSQPNLEVLQKADAPQQGVSTNNAKINKFNLSYLKGNASASAHIAHIFCDRGYFSEALQRELSFSAST